MTDTTTLPPLSVVPDKILSAQEQMAVDFEKIVRLYATIADNAAGIARCRKALFDAYLDEGFTEDQALQLVSGSLAL